MQALSDASALGELTVTVSDGRVTTVSGTVHELYADDYSPDPRVRAIAGQHPRVRFSTRCTRSSATAAERLGRQYKSESPVDVLAADILRRAGNADVAFLPGLGFGVTIQPGPITREMLVGLFPHPTSVIHERLSGRQILAILEQSATNLRPADDLDRVGGLIQTSGLRWKIDLTKPLGHRVSDVYVGERALDEDTQYRVTTNGGLLQGTHRQATFAEGKRDRARPTFVRGGTGRRCENARDDSRAGARRGDAGEMTQPKLVTNDLLQGASAMTERQRRSAAAHGATRFSRTSPRRHRRDHAPWRDAEALHGERHELANSGPGDDWMQELKGKHRTVFDLSAHKNGKPLTQAKNYLDAWRDAFKVPERDLNLVVGVHGDGIPLVLTDSLWSRFKIGEQYEVTDAGARGPGVRNVFSSANATAGGLVTPEQSVDALQKRGVRFLICMNTIAGATKKLSAAGFGGADEIRAALMGGLLPGVITVPAMVVALTQLQERGVKYMKIA